MCIVPDERNESEALGIRAWNPGASPLQLARRHFKGIMACMSKYVTPTTKSQSFSCPNCGAHAHQTWFSAHTCRLKDAELPFIPTEDAIAKTNELFKRGRTQEERDSAETWVRRLEHLVRGVPALHYRGSGNSTWCDYDLDSIHVSRCYTCRSIAIWRHEAILYPPHQYDVQPNSDLDAEIQADFNEARTVLDLSPRSAAALLRLCVQKLCIQLGQSGKNINDDIRALVAQGLDDRVKKALDLVRVIGNEAVHPGTLDLKDDRETAAKLFTLINLIAEEMITKPKALDALYDEKLTQGQKAQIARRDADKK